MFGIEIIDASLLPALIVAVFAGLISFLSPCVLPIVPPYLAYMSGVALTDVNDKRKHRKIVFTALFFVLGLSTVFLTLGFSASAIGTIFIEHTCWPRNNAFWTSLFEYQSVAIFRSRGKI
jgi:cytochrome c-type biogenesis protein